MPGFFLTFYEAPILIFIASLSARLYFFVSMSLLFSSQGISCYDVGMDIIRIREYDEDRIFPIYEDCGWTNYTENPGMLRASWQNSLAAFGAYDDDELVGIIRCVGDGASIVYIQDLLVKSEYQRQGVGTRLVETVLDMFRDVYQMVLLTDKEPRTVSFYNAMGFRSVDSQGCTAFIRTDIPEPDAG